MSQTTKIGIAVSLLAITLYTSGLLRGDEAAKCVAPNGWFPRTPKPDNHKPDPDKDCDFYQWAWQTFLYITQSEGEPGQPRFLTYPSGSDVFGSEATPRFATRSPNLANARMLMLAPRLEKNQAPSSLETVNQATSNGVLVDRNGRAVYYAIHVNDVFADFIKVNGYADFEKLKAAPANQEFPRGTLELKSSWRIVLPGEDASSYFTTKAMIPLLVAKGSNVVIDPNQTRVETVALVGLHVVGVVDGHPEFIWATFEHKDNAPDLPDKMLPTATQPVDSTRDWTFYTKDTAAKDCNRNPRTHLQLVDPVKQTLSPVTPVFREFAFGGDDDPDVIKSLNESVHAQLPADLAVWRNYELKGAVWLNDPSRDFKEDNDFAQKDAENPADKILGGDTKLSSSTMETFTQHTQQNCFVCHRTVAEPVPGTADAFPAKRIAISHVLTNAYANHVQHAASTPDHN